MRRALVLLAACGRIDLDAGTSTASVCFAMDDDPSAGAAPASDAAYTGTCTACPTLVTGHALGAYHFTGTEAILLPPISAGLVGGEPYTVTAWIDARTPLADNAGIVSKPYDLVGVRNVFKVEISNAFVRYETTFTTQSFAELDSTPNVLGAWHHIAATWDGATKRLYIDGALEAQIGAMLLDSDLAVLLGSDLDTGAVHSAYVGDIDDVCFWDVALSEREIASLADQ